MKNAGQKGFWTFDRKKRCTGYIFLAPWIFAAIFLLLYPVIFSLTLSFSDIQNFTTYELKSVGLENYKTAFFGDIHFMTCFNWLLDDVLINAPMIVIFSLLVAIMISRDIKCRGFFRAVFFLPVLLGTGYVMEQLLNQGVNTSAMNVTNQILLTPQVQAYVGPDIFEAATNFLGRITTVMWRSGVQIILFLAGIQKIPDSLYEAARVDSATEWDMFWKITLPMITPIMLLNIVYTIISTFDEQSPILSWISYQGFELSKFEYASAMGWIFFTVIMLIIGLTFLIMRPIIKRNT